MRLLRQIAAAVPETTRLRLSAVLGCPPDQSQDKQQNNCANEGVDDRSDKAFSDQRVRTESG
jgi:hypothetical protein